MKKIFIMFIFAAMHMFAQSSFALDFIKNGDGKNELDINLSQGFIHVYKLGDNSYTDINAIATYSRELQDQLQLLIEAGISSYPDDDSSTTIFTAMGGVTYNFDWKPKNSFFVQAAAGLRPAFDEDDGEYGSKFSFFVGGGKRIEIWNNIALKPLARLMKNGDQDMSILIMPFNVSMMF